MKNSQTAGFISQIISVVVDVIFPDGHLPKIYNALNVGLDNGKILVLEVKQHLGNNTVRTVAMGATDGLRRQLAVVDTGAPISVPAGSQALGRLFNVLGETIDNGKPLKPGK